ncbi:MAG: SDR family oxidoreductase [Methanoregula sp.]
MKYVITGGAGFIGSHLAEELLGQQHEVVVVDDLSFGNRSNLKHIFDRERFTFVEGSITDRQLLGKAFAGADGIFHEAAIASVPRSVADPLETNEINLSGTLNVLVAARDAGVKKVVFASSAAVYGNDPALPKQEEMKTETLSPYAVTKRAGEYYCSVFSQLYGVRCTALRYFNVFGPRQDPSSPYSGVITKFITNTLNNRPLTIFGDGTQTRDFVYVKDVVQANVRAMDSEATGIFNVACGKKINLLELAEMIREITGISVPVTFGPPASGDVHDSLADIGRAETMLGYSPAFTVRSGLEATVAWFREGAGRE